jgi:hypothetical protein
MNNLQKKSYKDYPKYKNRKEIKDNMHLFIEPIIELYSAWRLKSRPMLWCAINDMVKIFKMFEKGAVKVKGDEYGDI